MSHIVDILMPRLSDSMHEGTIIQWLKSAGEQVGLGEDLVEIETDKAQMTYGADQAGVLVEIIAEEGDTIQLGGLIARLEVQGDAPAAAAAQPQTEPEQPAAPVQTPQLEQDYEANFSAEPKEAAERVPVSPVARRTAEANGVDYQNLKGSGPDGRIVLADVEAAAASVAAPVAATASVAAPAAPVAPAKGSREASRLERLIAKRMVQGKSAPEFPSSRDIRIDELLSLRSQMKQEGVEPLPSINDFVLRAVSLALRSNPLLLCSWQDETEHIIQHEHINVGLAVATETSLIVPVIHDADQLSMGALATASRQLATQAREGTITPSSLEGGCFTVSNLGGMGVDRFQAILVPGQAGILAVGSARSEVRWGSQGPEPSTLMAVTLTADHRLVYGSHAAAFLADLALLLENPTRLVI